MRSRTAENFKTYAMKALVVASGKQTKDIGGLASDTDITLPSPLNISVMSKAPGIPHIQKTASIVGTGSRTSANRPRGQSVKPADMSGLKSVGKNIGEALSSALFSNPFGIDPSDEAAFLHGFKEGGFVTRKKNK